MGKIMLNDVTYSGTIYEANDSGGGGEIKQLPASRVTYDDDNTQLGVDTAQYAIEKLKKLNDNLSEKIPFSLMYDTDTKEYGYINNLGRFVPFDIRDGSEGDKVRISLKGNGTMPIAEIKVNNDNYTLLSYDPGLLFKGNLTEGSTLTNTEINEKPTKNWLMMARANATYKYLIEDKEKEESSEASITVKEGDAVYSDGTDWTVLFSTKTPISYVSEIEEGKGTSIGHLQANNNIYDIRIPDIQISELLSEGNTIAKITIGDEDYTIYSPSITGVKFEKADSYEELPDPGVEGTIYLVLKESEEETNVYTEYIWVVNDEVGAYEMLGDTAVKAVDIEVSADYTEGTKIATISVDDINTDLYAPIDSVELTLAEYNALPREEKMKDITYYIKDWDGGSASNPRLIELIGESTTLEGPIPFSSSIANKYDVIVFEVMGLRNGETMYRGTALSLPVDYLELDRDYPIQINYGNITETNYASGYAVYKKNVGITYWFARLQGVQPVGGMKCKVYGVKYSKAINKNPMANYLQLSAIMIDNRYTDDWYRISTGVNTKDYGDNLILEEKIQPIWNNNYAALGFITYKDEDSICTRVIAGTSTGSVIIYWNSKAGGGGITRSIPTTNPSIIKWSKEYYYINGERYNMSITAGKDCDSEIEFARLTLASKGQYLLHYGRIFNGEELVREYIPVKRISDGEVGFYETVEKKFYPNEGTGKFIAIY